MGKYKEDFAYMVRIGHTKSSCKINVPIELARKIGLDKAKHVLIIKTGDKKLEVKRYDGQEDHKEYLQGN